MLTFLELYQTLLGFVFFKLYTDAGLVYPPPLDAKKNEGGAGVGAFSLQDAAHSVAPVVSLTKVVEVNGKKISGKGVRQTIKSIAASSESNATDVDMSSLEPNPMDLDEEFVPQPSTSDSRLAASLPTLQSLSALPQSLSTMLFAPCTFFLSRESSRPIFEFIVRSFGGRIGWPASSGSGSPFDENEDSITHVIIDRPLVQRLNETAEERERRLRRKYIQPQWVVDCINAGKILLEEPYAQGKSLPPHLSPFGEYEGAYDPSLGLSGENGAIVEGHVSESEDDILDTDDMDGEEEKVDEIALKAAAAAAIKDPAALRDAELAAEAAGVDYGTFEKKVSDSRKKMKAGDDGEVDGEQDMNKMMMSNKQKKLYEKMKYSQKKRASEVQSLRRVLMNVRLTFVHFSGPIWNRRGKKSKKKKKGRSRLQVKLVTTDICRP